mmetsp:Transcript_19368/g.38889  ORF Transcript_19368/g.38889 Transcript_19368/m.38889 type:complete len:100 (+) Transcript_19368:230-529(+)
MIEPIQQRGCWSVVTMVCPYSYFSSTKSPITQQHNIIMTTVATLRSSIINAPTKQQDGGVAVGRDPCCRCCAEDGCLHHSSPSTQATSSNEMMKDLLLL